MNKLFALRHEMTITKNYSRMMLDTSYYVSAEILITKREFMPNIFTGIKRDTIYSLLYVPVIDYNYSEFKETIYIVDTSLERILSTYAARMFEASEKTYLEYC